MTEQLIPRSPFLPRRGVAPDDIPDCPDCRGTLRPWGGWRNEGGQLAECGTCSCFFGVVLLPRIRYAMVDATMGVWHASVHRLPTEVQHDAAELIAWRQRKPPPGSLVLSTGYGDRPITMIGDWCRLMLRHQWDESSVQEDELPFLLAFRQEDLNIPASEPLPKGSYETENPDSDLAPDAFRLHCGLSMIQHLAQEHPDACWRALDQQFTENGHRWLPRMDTTRGHNLLASFFLGSPMPTTVGPGLARLVGKKFPFRQR